MHILDNYNNATIPFIAVFFKVTESILLITLIKNFSYAKISLFLKQSGENNG